MILCPAQSMIYFHCLIVRFQEIILLIDPYKYEKLVPEDKMLLEMILRTRFCGTDFITQHG